jgi:BA14K-like protein
MNRFAKTAILGLATMAAAIAPLSQASADHRRHHRHHIDDGALIAGALGLAAGAIILGSINEPRVVYNEPDYYEPDVEYYPVRPGPRVIRPPLHSERVIVYRENTAGYEPWSREWFRYCSNRYRSFNADTGTYRGYDGRDHFCVAG